MAIQDTATLIPFQSTTFKKRPEGADPAQTVQDFLDSQQGQSPMQANDPVKLAGLRGDRADEMAHNLDVAKTAKPGTYATGATPSDLTGLQSDIAQDPFTGLDEQARLKKQQDASDVIQQFMNPDQTAMRQSQEAQKAREMSVVPNIQQAGETQRTGMQQTGENTRQGMGDTSREKIAGIAGQARVDAADASANKLNQPPAQIRAQMINATRLQQHVPDIRTDIDTLDKAGVLGPVMGRWNDFMVGKIGSSELTSNPDVARLLAKFRDDISFLSKGMAMVHGGARGGGSIQMMNSMEKMLNSSSMDKTLLNGSLDSFESWLKSYATDPNAAVNGTGTGTAPPGQAGGAAGHDSRTVQMVAPDGSIATVPTAQVQHFLSLGAKQVQ